MDNITQNHYESKYLENEPPILIKPVIAAALNSDRQAYFIQQVKYWMNKNAAKGRNEHDGQQWMFNTLEDWHAEFPWLSVMTIRRIVDALKEKGILITGNYNKKKYDKTTWYSINERKLDEVIEQYKSECSKRTKASVQNEHMDLDKKNTPIPETSSGTTKERGALPQSDDEKDEKQILNSALAHYRDLHSLRDDKPARITDADIKELKQVIKDCELTENDLTSLITLLFNDPDPWWLRNGWPLKTFCSQINKFTVKLTEKRRNEQSEKARYLKELEAELQQPDVELTAEQQEAAAQAQEVFKEELKRLKFESVH